MSIQVQIVLDQPHNVWTNLDNINGKIILSVNSTASIQSIVVKLEGESRTSLQPPQMRDMNTQPSAKPRNESHKVLYKVSQVFPPATQNTPGGQPIFQSHLTLNPGKYEFPFTFKIPFNNTCDQFTGSAVGNTFGSLANLAINQIQVPLRHVKTTLPPTLAGFPGMAEIRYFLKVTVNRKEFYKENPRTIYSFNFLPVEPPRKPPTRAQTYARRQHQFEISAGLSKGKEPFGLLRKQSVAAAHHKNLPHFSLDARLPSPPIITGNQDVPLRLIVRRLNDSAEVLYLHSLQIRLVGFTHFRALDIFREEKTIWICVDQKNIGQSLRSSGGGVGVRDEEIEIVPEAWQGRSLPTSVCPSFFTCNIGRKYELEILVGIGFGDGYARNHIILPLKHPVEVYSGIMPPTSLLAAMNPNSSTSSAFRPGKIAAVGAPAYFGSQSSSAAGASTPPVQPPRPSASQPPATGPVPLESGEEPPPPSYADAMAEDMAPIEGPRRNYQPPSVMEGGGFPVER